MDEMYRLAGACPAYNQSGPAAQIWVLCISCFEGGIHTIQGLLPWEEVAVGAALVSLRVLHCVVAKVTSILVLCTPNEQGLGVAEYV